MIQKNYTIALDIGTNSVGYAVLTDDYRLCAKKMKVLGNTDKKYLKKNLLGTLKFDSGETAEARRLKRGARRRYTRRAKRLAYLQEIFAEAMSKVDANFFARLSESGYIEEDKQLSKHPIFGTIEEELKYHEDNRTIYHLRRRLVDNKEQADLRLIYLALAHIIKYRGNFLIEGALNTRDISVEPLFKEFLKTYNETFSEQEALTDFVRLDENVAVADLLAADTSRTRKVENVLQRFPGEKTSGRFAQFLKLMVGNQANFKKHLPIADEAKLQLSKESFEEELERLLAVIGDEYAELFVTVKKIYNAIVLSGILVEANVETSAKLSHSMVCRYEEHQEDLKRLKHFIKVTAPSVYNEMFCDNTKPGYAGYIESGVSEEDFYNYLKKILTAIKEDSDEKQYFFERIEARRFLRKQRTFDNGVIPHQIHLEELRAIIHNQAKYYPFLEENQERIEQILTFRIPYYVGPIARNNSQFAWLTRTDEPIRPWNFEQVVDIEQSAMDFIERMTNTDTYLPSEKCLPKQSLIYQQYMIFNELTKVTYTLENNDKVYLTGKQKQAIFQKLFKQNRKVSKKKLVAYLESEEQLSGTTIEGIEEGFNASYSTYHDLIKIEQLKTLIEQPEHAEMFETIIRVLTIFDDRKMISKQLEQRYGEILTKETIKALSRKKYTGWGRLSRKLIHGIRDKKSNKTILEFLIEDDRGRGGNRNFMQLINDNRLSFKSLIEEARGETLSDDLHSVVSGLAGSPAIKRGILQSLKIVEELVHIMGYSPSNIVIEMARENQTTAKGKSKTRLKSLEKNIRELGSNILKEYPTTNDKLQSDRLYLYYLQNGKDMYTGEDLNIEWLQHYDVDHIIPQSLIKDNSIDNRVLTKQKSNRGKSDELPSQEIIAKMDRMWKHLLNAGLMSQRKYANLTKGILTEEDKKGFVRRQLVETRQITKHIAQILDQKYNPDKENKQVRVILLKSMATSRFRDAFKLYKIRELNDYHHAHDAYLNGVVALSLLKVYPGLAPRFVYGEYSKIQINSRNKATHEKNFNDNILKFFNKEQIVDTETRRLLWNRASVQKLVEKVIYKSQVNIVKKTEIQKGGFYKEIPQPKGSGERIPRKQGLDPKHYGGYIEPLIAYTLLITYEKGKQRKITDKFIGIKVLERAKFEKDERAFLAEAGYENVTRIIKLPKYSLFEFEGGRRRLLASASESQKGNQFALSRELIELLYHANHCDALNYPESYQYIVDHRHQFEQLLEEVQTFNSRFILAEAKMKQINDLYNKHRNTEDLNLLAQSFINLLTFTAMGAPADFNFFGVTIARKRYMSINECLKGTLIYQSITGLYETRIQVGD